MVSTVLILYVIIFSFISIFVLQNSKTVKFEQQFFLICLMFLFLLLLLYHGKKSDWRAYRQAVNNYSGIGSTYFEKGFDFLLFIASKTIGFEIIPIITSVLYFYYCVILYKNINIFINNGSFYIFSLSVFLGFLPIYFGAIRQAIAGIFILLGVVRFITKKYPLLFLDIILSVLFHNSSALILFLIFLIMVFHNFSNKHFIFCSILFTVLCYILFKVALEPILSFLDQASRLGDTDMNTDVGLKDLFIMFERIILLYCSYKILSDTKNICKIEKYICLYDIVGSLFFIALYQFARNMAGRTLGFFRYFDVYVLYFCCKKIFVNKNNYYDNKVNDICIIGLILYSIVRYYITVASAGVF